jgi:hypothetical protein
MKSSPRAILVLLLVGVSPLVFADCYSVIDPNGNVVYQAVDSPIDLSRPVSEGLAVSYPGHHLIIAATNFCPYISEYSGARAIPMSLAERTPSESGALFKNVRSSVWSGSEGAYLSYGGAVADNRRSTPGTEVRVRSYTRSDGAVVPAHTRSSPGRR